MFIENVSRRAIEEGLHERPSRDDYLIQITDVGSEFPKPMFPFRNVLRLKFNDVEENVAFCPKESDANMIAAVLTEARFVGANVFVHCQAGLCRSGAVASVGVRMGFEEIHTRRWPNRLLERLLREQLRLEPMSQTEYESLFLPDNWGG